MKIHILLIIILLSLSCSRDDNYVKGIGRVGFREVIIPDTVTGLDNVQIFTIAEATDGCWSNLYLELKKIKEFEYSIKAFGTYESSGACICRMVYSDSVINFQPNQRGIYLFKISQLPYRVVIDTMVVE